MRCTINLAFFLKKKKKERKLKYQRSYLYFTQINWKEYFANNYMLAVSMIILKYVSKGH